MKASTLLFTTSAVMTVWVFLAVAPLVALNSYANVEPLNGSSGDDLPPIVATDLTPEEAYQRGQEFFSIDTPSAQERAEKWLRSAAERVISRRNITCMCCWTVASSVKTCVRLKPNGGSSKRPMQAACCRRIHWECSILIGADMSHRITTQRVIGLSFLPPRMARTP